MKKLASFLLLIFMFSCTSEDSEPNAAPTIGDFRVNGLLKLSNLLADQSYQFSFRASDDYQLKSYTLDLLDENLNYLVTLEEALFSGRLTTVNSSFSIPLGFDHGDYTVRITVRDSDGETRSLGLNFTLVVNPPLMNIFMNKSTYREGDRVSFTGHIRDKEDLVDLRIFIYRDENFWYGLDTIGQVIYREFTGSNDTLYNLSATSEYIDLPSSMTIDTYSIWYRLRDSDGNYINYATAFPVLF